MNGTKSNSRPSNLVADPRWVRRRFPDESSKIAGALGNDPTAVALVENMQQLEKISKGHRWIRQRAVRTLDAMNQLARYLSGLGGRKNLIWFSALVSLSNILPESRYVGVAGSVLGGAVGDGRKSFVRRRIYWLGARSPVYPVDSRGLVCSAHDGGGHQWAEIWAESRCTGPGPNHLQYADDE